jgi:predicted peptidase
MVGGHRLVLVDSSPLRSLLSIPRNGEQEGALRPVICFLHGYAEAAPLEIYRALRRHGPLRKSSSPMALERFIVIAPQLPPPGGDVWFRYAESVRQIVQGLQADYGGDPGRTYLTGFSFGGNGVFDLADLVPGFWAALWPVDPTRIPQKDPGLPVWLSFGEISRWHRAAFIRTLGFKDAGAGNTGDRVYLDQGKDHVGSATSAYADDRVYSWLLSQSLKDRGITGTS